MSGSGDIELFPRPKLLPPGWFFVCLAAQAVLHLIVPVVTILPWPINLVGLFPIAAGAAVTVWADWLFKKRNTTVLPHVRPSALIRTGPFRFSRNPMYLGMVIILVGTAMMYGSLTPYVPALVFFLVMHRLFIPGEESALRSTFGEHWRVYEYSTRRWL
jgi:protein-S-isoprenylcysteine O-methyltransferase Ste14